MSIKNVNIKQEDAAFLYGVYERVLGVLSESEAVLWDLPKGPERDDYIHAYGAIVTDVLCKLRAPLVRRYPELDTTRPEGPSDLLIDRDAQEAVNRLTSSQVQQIDAALLADCAPSWRKVARVVGTAMSQLYEAFPEIPDGYYATRIVHLVKLGHLESQGNLEYMGFSEVRLCA
nr:DUF3658 domain-containing protein [Rhodoferax sp.]